MHTAKAQSKSTQRARSAYIVYTWWNECIDMGTLQKTKEELTSAWLHVCMVNNGPPIGRCIAMIGRWPKVGVFVGTTNTWRKCGGDAHHTRHKDHQSQYWNYGQSIKVYYNYLLCKVTPRSAKYNVCNATVQLSSINTTFIQARSLDRAPRSTLCINKAKPYHTIEAMPSVLTKCPIVKI
jgi:hypothetical protein